MASELDMSKALDMMQHAVGYPKFYRNHYCLGPDCEETAVWEALVAMKLAWRSTRQASWTRGMTTYGVTPAGIAYLKELRKDERRKKREAKAKLAAERAAGVEVTNA